MRTQDRVLLIAIGLLIVLGIVVALIGWRTQKTSGILPTKIGTNKAIESNDLRVPAVLTAQDPLSYAAVLMYAPESRVTTGETFNVGVYAQAFPLGTTNDSFSIRDIRTTLTFTPEDMELVGAVNADNVATGATDDSLRSSASVRATNTSGTVVMHRTLDQPFAPTAPSLLATLTFKARRDQATTSLRITTASTTITLGGQELRCAEGTCFVIATAAVPLTFTSLAVTTPEQEQGVQTATNTSTSVVPTATVDGSAATGVSFAAIILVAVLAGVPLLAAAYLFYRARWQS